ncbi:hypothetical protein [Sphaerospermopsis torques-reginae]|uniref:Uncharacterized protein n=1 Tax=Sphaerospermopsis torques-reginae ITEP-024 TaxID=984208 RepID=A0ABX8WVN0_9CYAN|nr:hypothetical protein K2F26_16505 [Sphaerospermopsis torques-reginae ITEP-024]
MFSHISIRIAIVCADQQIHSEEAQALRDLAQAANIEPTFRTPNCHKGKLRREKLKISIKTDIYSEKRHLRNSKSPKMASKPIINKKQ